MGNTNSSSGPSSWIIVLCGLAATAAITVVVVQVQSVLLGIWSRFIAGDQRPDFSTNGAEWLDLAMLFIAPLEALMIGIVFVIVIPIAYSNARVGEVPLTDTRIAGITTVILGVASVALIGPDLVGLSLAVPLLAIAYLSMRGFLAWAERQRRA